MKAFLSYSLTDNDQFVIPLVTQKLQAQGFFVTNGSYKPVVATNSKTTVAIDRQTLNEINTASLFIGVITSTGASNEQVYQEWLHSSNQKTPSILLVEDTYPLHPDLLTYPNVIRFNREFPRQAIDSIKLRINNPTSKLNQINELAPLLIGGAALIALVALLGKE